VPGSSSSETRSRGSSWLRFSKRSREAADLATLRCSQARTRWISASMPSRFALKVSLPAKSLDSMCAMSGGGLLRRPGTVVNRGLARSR